MPFYSPRVFATDLVPTGTRSSTQKTSAQKISSQPWAVKMPFYSPRLFAADLVPTGTRSSAQKKTRWIKRIFPAPVGNIYYHMPYRRNSLYCISVFHCWFFHSEYSVKLCLGKSKCPRSKSFPKYVPSTLGEAGRKLFPKSRANVKGISRHVVK